MVPASSARAPARLLTATFAVTLIAGLMYFRPGCVDLVVWASFEKEAQLQEIAADYERTGPSEDLRCVKISVRRVASGDAEEALRGAANTGGPGMPDVWSPAATTWVHLLERHRSLAGLAPIVPSSAPSIVHSPLVIAMPEPMARALGWPATDISWTDIFTLAQDRSGWAGRGHPEWGRFKFAKTTPVFSTSGLHMLLATFLRSGGGSIEDPTVLAFMRSVEESVVHYGPTVSAFLVNLWEADDRGEALTYVSAIAMEEKQVWEYNRGNPEFRYPGPTRLPPRERLIPIYPSEGTLMADHPYVVMPWVDEQKGRVAARFLDHLRSDSVQQEFLRNAFRGARRETGEYLERSPFDRFKPAILFSLPDPTTIERVVASWSTYRKRARVLFVMDVSGSMAERVAPGSASKLELAKAA